MSEVITYFVLFVLIVNVIFVFVNFLNLSWDYNISNLKTIHSEELVSILIPARNEEKNIDACLQSLFIQSYPNIEIILLDDNSTDDTYCVSKKYLSNMNFLLIKGKPLPEGWLGKNYACHQLQEAAKGEFLLFTDADTVFEPDAVSKAITFLKNKNSDLLSLMPHEITKTFWEKVIIPMIHFVVYTLLPLKLVEKSKDQRFVMANGQFMLFRREMYDIIGCHRKLKNKIVEDVSFGKEVKMNKGKLIFANGSGIVKCRMYDSLDEIIKGFTKNLFPGLSFSSAGLFLVLFTFAFAYLFPFPLFFFGIISNDSLIIQLTSLSILLPIVSRISQSIQFRLPLAYSFIHFLSVIMFIFIGLNSFKKIRKGIGAEWKGRFYKEALMRDE